MYKDLDIETFMNDINLNNVYVDSLDINIVVESLEKELTRVLDKHAPVKTRTVTHRKKQPFYNQCLKNQKHCVRNRERIWRKYRETHQRKALNIERNKYNRMLRKYKFQELNNKISECGRDTKKLFNLVNNITGRVETNPLPTDKSEETLTKEFANFFLSKILKIRNELRECNPYCPKSLDIPQFSSFRYMHEDEVASIIRSMPSKSCETDCIPTNLLKQILPKIITALTNVVNLSLETGQFAVHWKTAIVRPLLKKQGLDLIPNNYRPVSNLPFISKLVEKCMLHQFNQHCDTYHLLPDYQSAYRKNYSCETALVKFVSDMLVSMEHQKVTAVVAIDLSAAFDTVDHSILLSVLNSRFGMTDVALDWFRNYLSPRSFKVKVGETCSVDQQVNFSVPQGSCAGPILYSAYASTMQDSVPASIAIHGYADDHALKASFQAGFRDEESRVITQLQQCISNIKTWMDGNRLRMNSSKTEFLIVGSRQQLQKTNTCKLDVNGDLIDRSHCIKYLGVEVDENLNFKNQISYKCKVAMGNFYRLKQIRGILTKQSAKVLACCLVLSHLDYANALYIGLPDVEINKLQRIQNMTAKLVTNSKKYDSAKKALKDLHWLPIRQRIIYKILTLIFKCLSGDAPLYLQNLIIRRRVNRPGMRSSKAENLLEIPFTRAKTFADRSFFRSGTTSVE